MTDARFPDHWMHDARIQGLSAEHFRALMHALAWCAANRTDGFIRTENLSLIPRLDRDAVAAFAAAELFVKLDDGWLITVYLATQTSRAEFEANDRLRAGNRERKAKSRAAKAAGQQDVTRDVTRDVTADSIGRQAGRQESTKSNQEGEGDSRARARENGAQPYTPTAGQQARIEDNVRAGYES